MACRGLCGRTNRVPFFCSQIGLSNGLNPQCFYSWFLKGRKLQRVIRTSLAEKALAYTGLPIRLTLAATGLLGALNDSSAIETGWPGFSCR